MKTCPICGKPAKQHVVCDACHALPEQQKYDLICKRFDDAIDAAKATVSQAYKSGDQEELWLARAVVTNLERQKQSLRKPK